MAGKAADLTGEVGWGDTGPFWAARAFNSKRGQDHLGLASVSQDHILPMLSPGINVLTPHPRYWSFYLLVLDEFWRRELRPSAFRDFFRAREAAFSMACHVCEAPEHASIQFGINGALKIAPHRLDPVFEPSAVAVDYMVSALGGYGLYYRTAMESTGVLAIARRGSGLTLDAPTPTGQAIAAAYRKAIAGTILWADYLCKDMEGLIHRDDLVEFARGGPPVPNSPTPQTQIYRSRRTCSCMSRRRARSNGAEPCGCSSTSGWPTAPSPSTRILTAG